MENFWAGTKAFARWMRDKFAEWLAATTVFTFMWLAVGCAIAVLFVWDGEWSRAQAPEGMEGTFQAAGWVVRLWTVFALAGSILLFKRGAAVLGVIVGATWLAAAAMAYGHALGFVATGQIERYAGAEAVTNVEQVVTTSTADQIAVIERQKTQIREDRDAKVERLQASIFSILNDRIATNDHLADVYRADQTKAEEEAAAAIAQLDAHILRLMEQSQTASLTARTEEPKAVAFDPLYIWMAEFFHGKDHTTDQLRNMAKIVGAYWALLVELVGGVGPAVLFAAHAHLSGRADKRDEEAVSDDVPAGHKRVEFTLEEWAEWEAAYAKHKKQKRAGEDKAPARSPLRLGNKEWVRQTKQKIQDRYDEGMSPQDIADSFGFQWSEYEALILKMFNAKAAKKYLGQPDEQEPDPRAAVPPVQEPEAAPEKPHTNGALTIWEGDLPVDENTEHGNDDATEGGERGSV
jgi:hypothetical protein